MNSSSKSTDANYRVESLGVQYRSDEYAIAIDWTALRSWKVPFHSAAAVEPSSAMAGVTVGQPRTRRRQRSAR